MFIQLKRVVRESAGNADVSLFNVYLLSEKFLSEPAEPLSVNAIKHTANPSALLH